MHTLPYCVLRAGQSGHNTADLKKLQSSPVEPR